MGTFNQKIGIIGGGQLGKMMILDAKRMGFYIISLDPDKDCPSHSISDEHIVAAFDDQEALRQLAVRCDLVTYEFEHIEADYLKGLVDEGYSIYPSPKALIHIQNKYVQKNMLKEAGLPVPDLVKVDNLRHLEKTFDRWGPIMVKSCYDGYDGKGNFLVEKKDQCQEAYNQLKGDHHLLMAEKKVAFVKEMSVLACRSKTGELVTYPVAENQHVNSVLAQTLVPADIPEASRQKAIDLAGQVMEVFNGVGMFCVEFFLTERGEILINEVAPRPHNSGHYTIEGCPTSQFENHIRAIAGLPLGRSELLKPTAMVNILGNGQQGKAQVFGGEEAMKLAGVKLHIYGKKESRPGRKMGHITLMGENRRQLVETVNDLASMVQIGGRYED